MGLPHHGPSRPWRFRTTPDDADSKRVDGFTERRCVTFKIWSKRNALEMAAEESLRSRPDVERIVGGVCSLVAIPGTAEGPMLGTT